MAAGRNSLVPLALAAGLVLASHPTAALGVVKGQVVNATIGRPAAGVALTLSSFRDGMTPLEETVSDSDGSFSFSKELPSVSGRQPFAGAIRAEQDGVFYTEILSSDDPLDNVVITVHSTSETDLPEPNIRLVILEPSGEEMNVREIYMFANDSDPPVTYSSEDGTLRFHLPESAQGEVDVSGEGPAGMPLPSSALPTAESGIYKVDFPLKPGQNTITLNYRVAHEENIPFTLRSVYDGVETRLAAPEGVSVSGSDLTSFGEHPETRASIYSVAPKAAVELRVEGQGQLRAPETPATGAPAQISIEPAPIAKELFWILGISVLIFGLGFYHLLKSTLPDGRGVAQREKG